MTRTSILTALVVACFPLASGAAEPDVFKQTVSPFLAQHCVKCHGPEKQKGMLTLHDIDGNLAGKDAAKWKSVLERLTLGEMPPKEQPRPDAKVVASVLTWLKAGVSSEASAEIAQKLVLPGQGNRVDHDALFSGAHKGPAASPPRLWRMSPSIYRNFLPRLAGPTEDRKTPKVNKIPQAFSVGTSEGIKDYADLYILDEPTLNQLLNNAKAIVEAQTSTTSGRQIKEFLPLIDAAQKPTEEQIKAALRKQCQLVIMREPTGPELDRLMKLMAKNITDCGQVIGAKATLAAVMLHPEALYRVELGKGKEDKHGRVMLSPRELAHAIAFALTDEGPDAALHHAADQGKLATSEDVRREVQRILNEKGIAKPRILRFFEEYFEYPEAEDVFKDLEKFLWQPRVIVGDTRHLVLYILDQDKDVLKELLTTNKSFINYKVGADGPQMARDRLRGLAKPNIPGIMAHYNELYGLPLGQEWTAKQPIELPKDQRAGILTQPSWLAAFATNDETHPIHRGKWVRERLFAGNIPDVPLNVDAKLPDTPDKTMRERMEITKQEYCWQCHQQMNPVGLTFEHYDFIGRYRKQELVVNLASPPKPVDTTKSAQLPKAKRGETKIEPPPIKAGFLPRPLDASGTVANTGDPKVDGEVKNIVELMHKVGDSPRIRQVFVRHAFRYWMGRNETLDDSPTLMAADKAYVDSGGSMKALIASLLSSDSFVYRKLPKQPTATSSSGGGQE